jgi:acyl-CoA synthetase (NDP forming)
VPVSNPLDITAQGLSEPEIYTRTLEALLDDPRVGTVMAGIIQAEAVTCAIKYPAILAAVEGKTLTKPLIFAGLDEGAPVPPNASPPCARRAFPGSRRPSAPCGRSPG